MDKKAILINGPPHSGKDTAAIMIHNMIAGRHAVGALIPFRPHHLKFADPLKAAAHALYSVPYSCEHFEKEHGNEWKDRPAIEFMGERPRDVYIALSETFAKQRPAGKAFFGRIAARRIRFEKSDNVFIFSDSGFGDEAKEVIREVGLANTLVVQLSRPGTSFAGDSRGYVGEILTASFPGLCVADVPNIGDKMLFRTLLQGMIIPWLDMETTK